MDTYKNVTARNVLDNEDICDHHTRLACLLQLHTVRFLLSLPLHTHQSSDDWLSQWQGSLEFCDDVVAVESEWVAPQRAI